MSSAQPPLEHFLAQSSVLVLDGALATELERRGADLRDPLWSAKVLLEDSDLIRQVHFDYFKAGADVATSASYQATLPGLMRRGLSRSEAETILRLSVRLACEARDRFCQETRRPLRPLVAASVGCYGAFLHDGSEYRGDYGLSVRELMDWHRPRLQILADSGADLLACETIPCLAEGEALARLLDEVPGPPAWLSFSCRDGRRLNHGELLSEGVAMANHCPRIVAVGVNCTPPTLIVGLLRSVAAVAQKPFVAYPNSGERWDAQRQAWQAGAAVFDWGAAARAWRDAGARLIGGCCRTTPETVAQIARAMGREAASGQGRL
jgi:homocysteine S-methyltransferase